ncbi:PREDICTED: uncharacterized protein LOC105142935 [Acromyrmex echinatior]|uniref:uncharacterized protein LOC105142935 n=1 Tax=Acromyrmex echinatior TaxID=103372 RepID=UPI000580F627|nr:PREDICTED: uncharacterized protein LOC105142935 [Acromyrmex echinatior]
MPLPWSAPPCSLPCRGVAESRRRESFASRQRCCKCPRCRKHAPSARTTTGVVIRADLVEGCGFTDLPLLPRTRSAQRNETEQRSWIRERTRVGWPDGANAGEPLATTRGIDVLRPENNAL